jgi:hypothetical protein
MSQVLKKKRFHERFSEKHKGPALLRADPLFIGGAERI